MMLVASFGLYLLQMYVCMYVGMCVCVCVCLILSSLCGIVQAEDNVEEIIQTSNSEI